MTPVARWAEVHRLAVAGREAGIARDVGGRVGRVWLARSRFADVARLAELTLTLGKDARASYQLGWAKDATGDRAAALAAYGQALRLYRAAADRAGEAVTLSNMGAVYDGLGERQRALEYFGQALPIRREVGDRAGEAATLNNIGEVYRGRGELQRALEYYGQALPIRREVGDRAGEAVTRYNRAVIHRAQGGARPSSRRAGAGCRAGPPGRPPRPAVRHRDAPPRTPGAGELGPGARVAMTPVVRWVEVHRLTLTA